MNLMSIIDRLSGVFGRGKVIRFIFNIWPMYRATGGRVMKISEDLHYVKIKLPLTLRTKNYVGTLYGGHMYSCVDGLYMVQLINIMGKDYVIWDKSATIKFRRPGNTTLYAEFDLKPEFIESIKNEVAEAGEKDFVLHVDLCDKEGKVYAEVDKTIYIATKDFYKEKRRKKAAAVQL